MQRPVSALAKWFVQHHRPLPWRTNLPSAAGYASLAGGLLTPRDAYSTLVAEMMLQQTQVSRVLEYLPRFLRKFPTVADLAAADESQVLGAWAGLGYYRRAKLLHRAAREVMTTHRGTIPQDLAGLLSLPGVGRYTAGAIASIALHQTAGILDGNITRVLMRLSGCASPPMERSVQGALWQMSELIASIAAQQQGTPAIVNEGLMELGAMICTPVNPRCEACPIAHDCRARALGLQDSIPLPKPAAKSVAVHIAAIVITQGNQVVLQQRPDAGLFASMLTPITLESPSRMTLAKVRRWIAPQGMALVKPAKPITTYIHQLTHRTLHIHVYRAALARTASLPPDCRWHPISALADLPIASAHRKALNAAIES